jgi:pyruvate dehydrogenase E2 component (dihydrolipoamide acetyltransferase)
MIKQFTVPAIGDSIAEVEIVEWLVEIGAEVSIDDEILTIETDKSVTDVPSPWAGTVVARHGEPGDVLAVGEPLFDLECE